MIFCRLSCIRRAVVLVPMLLAVVFVGQVVAAPDIVAKVGGIPITKYELQREQQAILPLNVNFHGAVSQEKLAEIRNKALTGLIDQAYKVQYALAEEVSLDNKSVEKTIQPVMAKFKTAKDFEKGLGGESLSAYRASVYRALLAKKAEQIAVDAKVNVTDSEVKSYYEANRNQFKRPRQFKASHILIKVPPSSNTDEVEGYKKKSEELLVRAKAGEDFYNLAYYNSDDASKYVGGDVGYFHEGQAAEEFEAAVLKMKPGEIAGPVRTLYGFHIIKLVEVNEPRQLSFEEMKDKLRQTLEKKERETLYEAWMTGLKKKYQLQRFDQ